MPSTILKKENRNWTGRSRDNRKIR